MLRSSISVRFDEDTAARLRRVSQKSSLTETDLIRLAVLQFLQTAEQSGKIEVDLLRDAASLSSAKAGAAREEKKTVYQVQRPNARGRSRS